jgi:hypothetical protein
VCCALAVKACPLGQASLPTDLDLASKSPFGCKTYKTRHIVGEHTSRRCWDRVWHPADRHSGPIAEEIPDANLNNYLKNSEECPLRGEVARLRLALRAPALAVRKGRRLTAQDKESP